MAAKNTAHRPSQRHMKFVRNSYGERVINTAYKPAPWEQPADEHLAALVKYETKEAAKAERELNPGFHHIEDELSKKVLSASGLGDPKAGYESLQAAVDEDFNDVFADHGYNPSVYDLKVAIGENDAIRHAADQVVDQMTRRYEHQTGYSLSNAERERVTDDLIQSGFFAQTQFGKAIERADGIVSMARAEKYAEANGYDRIRTPDKDYMGAPSWAGTKSGGYKEDEKVADLKATLKDMKEKKILVGRTSVSKMQYSTRTVKVKNPGFDAAPPGERRVVQDRVEKALAPITTAYDYNAGNLQYDYFNSARTNVIVTG